MGASCIKAANMWKIDQSINILPQNKPFPYLQKEYICNNKKNAHTKEHNRMGPMTGGSQCSRRRKGSANPRKKQTTVPI